MIVQTRILVFLLIFFLYPLFLRALPSETLQTSAGETLELTFRALEPGEIILAALKENPNLEKVTIRFLGKKYLLENNAIAGLPFALIGLDLNLKPKSYLMKISVDKKDGSREDIWKRIVVLAKEFPIKKLWVKEEFVTPPPEVQERIQREAEILEAVYSVPSAEWLGEGEFVLPFSGEAAPNFGERRIYNNLPRSIHTGVDIEAPLGAPICASNSGKVVLASDMYFSGKTVIIDHGLGLFTFYCHFSKIKVKRGEQIKKGEVIGLAGATGRATGPHLHWGVKIFESRVDPFALLSLVLR